MLNHSQKDFYAINMKDFYSRAYDDEDQYLVHLPLQAAEQDGALKYLASTSWRARTASTTAPTPQVPGSSPSPTSSRTRSCRCRRF